MLSAADGPSCHHDDGWFNAWFGAFASEAERIDRPVRCIVEVEALGPLRLRVCRSATNVHSIGFDSDAEPDADLPRQLFARSGADVLRFDYLDADARLLRGVPAWRGRHRLRVAPHAIAPLADCRQGAAAWFAARSKRLRQRLRGDAAACDRLGLVTHCGAGEGDVDALMDEVIALEGAGWKGREGSAIRDDPAAEIFYRRLAHHARAVGALRIATLRRDGVLVAFEFGVLHARRLSVLKVGYDEALADASPGFVLAKRHIVHCCDDAGIDWYDKMGNGMTPAAYKLRFADTQRTYHRLTIYRASWRGWLAWAHDEARARAKAWRDARRAAA